MIREGVFLRLEPRDVLVDTKMSAEEGAQSGTVPQTQQGSSRD